MLYENYIIDLQKNLVAMKDVAKLSKNGTAADVSTVLVATDTYIVVKYPCLSYKATTL